MLVAQAFHWFDAPRALDEIARVLLPGGVLGLVWNLRDDAVAWVAELTEALNGAGDVLVGVAHDRRRPDLRSPLHPRRAAGVRKSRALRPRQAG